jgi:hypothetical protein
MPVRFIALLAALAVSLSPGVPIATAAGEPVDLELVLAVDVSGSIDDTEARVQREGYIAAFRDPRVVEAIEHGMLGRIAVAYYEWAGFGHIRVIADWTLIDDRQSAEAFADGLARLPPQTARRTAIASAIDFAVPYFERNRFDGTRRVVDVSGDGPNNWGGPVTTARDAAVAAGITVNGLPIVNGRSSRYGSPPMPDLDLYYRDCVIGGSGAFIEVAESFEDFGRAVLRKLILEIAGVPPTPRIVRVVERRAPPCDVGEALWRDDTDF